MTGFDLGLRRHLAELDMQHDRKRVDVWLDRPHIKTLEYLRKERGCSLSGSIRVAIETMQKFLDEQEQITGRRERTIAGKIYFSGKRRLR